MSRVKTLEGLKRQFLFPFAKEFYKIASNNTESGKELEASVLRDNNFTGFTISKSDENEIIDALVELGFLKHVEDSKWQKHDVRGLTKGDRAEGDLYN